MVASYPSSVRIFTTKVDNDDINYAAHINDLQDEVVAIQQTVGSEPQGAFGTLKARVGDLETSKSDTGHNHAHNNLTGLTTGNPHTQYLLRSLLTTKGDIAVFDGTSWQRLAAGANGSGLVADSTTSTGLRWSASNAVTSSSFTAKGDLLVGTSAENFTAIGVGANGRALLADSATSTGLAWSASAPVFDSAFDAKGDLLVGTGSGTKTRVSVGANGRMPLADSGAASGVRWGTNPILGGYSERVFVDNAATGTITIDASQYNAADLLAVGNVTLAFSNIPAGLYSLFFRFVQDATGGRTLSFPAGTKWQNASPPAPSTGANDTNAFGILTFDQGASWLAFLSGKDMG